MVNPGLAISGRRTLVETESGPSFTANQALFKYLVLVPEREYVLFQGWTVVTALYRFK